MLGTLQTIQLFGAPVVMISACGLLCLALYHRLATIVSRTRAFHKERFDAAAKLAAVEKNAVRAVPVRNSLVCMLTAVLCTLGCSTSLGLSLVWHWCSRVALVTFSVGVAVMIAAQTPSGRRLHDAHAA